MDYIDHDAEKTFKKWKNELYSSPKNSLMMLARRPMALIRCQVITKPKSLCSHARTVVANLV